MNRKLLICKPLSRDYTVLYPAANTILEGHLNQLIRLVTIGRDDFGDFLTQVNSIRSHSRIFAAPDGIKIMEGILNKSMAREITSHDEFYIPWSVLCFPDSHFEEPSAHNAIKIFELIFGLFDTDDQIAREVSAFNFSTLFSLADGLELWYYGPASAVESAEAKIKQQTSNISCEIRSTGG